MEVSALKYSGGISLHGRSPLLRLQSDERLIAYLRKGNMAAFEVLLSRYEVRLLAFCRHLLGCREDAEDVMQEVMTAAFNAILADDRPINVRPWLYRIARNRSLNHLRRIQAIGVDSMDLHYSDNGASTADKVHEREEFRLLVGDIHELPETQKTALVLREMDALSYEQIAEAMETTVPSVKSLLVRARVSLAEASEARLLSCDEVRIELGEVAEGLRRRPSPLVRRHLRACERCTVFRGQLKETNKALAALMPIGPLVILKKLALAHLGHSAGAGSGATAVASGSGAAAAGSAGASAAGAGVAGAGAGGAALAGSGVAAGSGGFISAGLGAIASKAAAGLAAAALVTAGAVEADHSATRARHHHRTTVASVAHVNPPAQQALVTPLNSQPEPRSSQQPKHAAPTPAPKTAASKTQPSANQTKTKPQDATKASTTTSTAKTPAPATTNPTDPASAVPVNTTASLTGRTQTQQDPTVMASTIPAGSPPAGTDPSTGQPIVAQVPSSQPTTATDSATSASSTQPDTQPTAPVTQPSPAPPETTPPPTSTPPPPTSTSPTPPPPTSTLPPTPPPSSPTTPPPPTTTPSPPTDPQPTDPLPSTTTPSTPKAGTAHST